MYDMIVVGGGHAGCEAALAGAKLHHKTLLVTGNLSMVASLPCNPSIGGPAKGIVVREIDALGGMQGKVADIAQIQTKMLNESKGPAVRALRMQADKIDYPKVMRSLLEQQENLELLEALVESIIIEDGEAKGIHLQDGRDIFCKKLIVTTGTYLNSRILRGHTTKQEGPDGQPTTFGISEQLGKLGFKILRLKTGTPARIKTSSIDFSQSEVQPGSTKPLHFSFDDPQSNISGQSLPCHLIYTNESVHQIIMDHIQESAMYGGIVEGIGPRYCPSIEDKLMRFRDKTRHQIFLEPESVHLDQTYIQGFSTSMPIPVQEKMIRSLPGLEHCEILKYAYAIEYDAIDPTQLWPTLETKQIKNLYTAGQINGTSGYEEAACQGLMASINAILSIEGKEPFILKRHEAYIGVLIDDLVTKGTQEPYRLLTSRADYRLLLRHDNADLRLREYGYQIGLINELQRNRLIEKKEQIASCITYLKGTNVGPKEFVNEQLISHGSSPITNGISLLELIKRPEIDAVFLQLLYDIPFSIEVLEQAEIETKYDGYIKKTFKDAEKLVQLETKQIPVDLDYDKIGNIALEAREKLKKIKPLTIGQAMRISGVNPADIAVLSVYIAAKRGE